MFMSKQNKKKEMFMYSGMDAKRIGKDYILLYSGLTSMF